MPYIYIYVYILDEFPNSCALLRDKIIDLDERRDSLGILGLIVEFSSGCNRYYWRNRIPETIVRAEERLISGRKLVAACAAGR